jgi:hypothetical protein
LRSWAVCVDFNIFLPAAGVNEAYPHVLASSLENCMDAEKRELHGYSSVRFSAAVRCPHIQQGVKVEIIGQRHFGQVEIEL